MLGKALLKLLVQDIKFRWFVLSFLFGLLGTVAIGFLIFSIQEPSIRYPSTGGTIGGPGPLPSPTPLPEKVVSAEKAINDALKKIPKGAIYHNVPKEMQVGVSETIEAGIAPRVTEQIKKKIQGRGNINVESGVKFDPSGMEMKLDTQPSEFEVFEVKGGEQFVTANTPGKWIWRVKPLKAGNNLIVIKASVKLSVPELDVTKAIPIEVFSATRKVKVNLVYSTLQFIN